MNEGTDPRNLLREIPVKGGWGGGVIQVSGSVRVQRRQVSSQAHRRPVREDGWGQCVKGQGGGMSIVAGRA